MALLSSSTDGWNIKVFQDRQSAGILSMAESVTVFFPQAEVLVLVVFCPPLHLFASGFLHALMHGMSVAIDNREVNTLAKVKPIVIGAALSNPPGIISGFSLSVVSDFSEGTLLYSTSAALLAVIAGSSSAIPSSNQSGSCLFLLLKVSMAEL